MYSAKILCDSISPNDVRLSTLEVTFPRFVLAEFNTHRVFSRNSASSRAIPTAKLVNRVITSPAKPIEWGSNKSGMQAGELLPEQSVKEAEWIWGIAAANSTILAQRLEGLGAHKQTVNRLLEPFLWHTVIVTATEWQNFFDLRCSPMAQPEIHRVADLMKITLNDSNPTLVDYYDWHLPLIQPDEIDIPIVTKIKISVARCARVSYLTHDGKRSTDKDIELHDRLVKENHLSPFEHVATPTKEDEFFANFKGWIQARKYIEDKMKAENAPK